MVYQYVMLFSHTGLINNSANVNV